jgi:hypothetical protein
MGPQGEPGKVGPAGRAGARGPAGASWKSLDATIKVQFVTVADNSIEALSSADNVWGMFVVTPDGKQIFDQWVPNDGQSRTVQLTINTPVLVGPYAVILKNGSSSETGRVVQGSLIVENSLDVNSSFVSNVTIPARAGAQCQIVYVPTLPLP